MSFDLVIAADWSSGEVATGARPRKDAIWVCARLWDEVHLEYFPTRHAALRWIEDWLGQGHRTLLGFDFAYGWPAGFAERLTGQADALAVWDWLADRIEDGPDNANNRFDIAARINDAFPGVGPLWGHPHGRSYPGLPARKSDRRDLDLGEHRVCEEVGSGAKSVFQLAYAGAVGGQSLVGQAALARLRAAHPEIVAWPQQTGFVVPEGRIVLVEIYPSLFDDVVEAHEIKDARQVLATASAFAAMPDDWFTAPAGLPDRDRIAREEGWILGVGPTGPMSSQGRAPDDCFALPPGVHWTPVDEAMATLSALTPVTSVEEIPVEAAAGRVLAQDLRAKRANPPTPNAAVDGWGYAAATLPEGEIPVAEGRAAAGQPYGTAVPPGQALRILTGAALPDGVDTIVLQEDATVRDGHLQLAHRPKPGANTRAAGEDVARGDPILRAGNRLRPSDIALAIAAGHGSIPIHVRLRVAVLSTGDEIVPPGTDGTGIYDANRPMLLAMLEAWGVTPVDLGHVGDDAAELADTLDRAAETDAILTSGGASAGEEDHLSRLLSTEGSVAHWRIAVKPGRPLALGRWRGTPLFGLPGNPVAAFTCAAFFARPALLRLAGMDWLLPRRWTVPAAFTKTKKPGRREYLRSRLDPEGRAEVFRSEGSGRVSGLSWAEGFVELPDEAASVKPGDPVRYIPFSELGLG
ncbi:molybdopterin-binding protein [Jannaschia aquimarina]|uniref:Molybdopterin molybdenumtransferase n=1 Tax=Jannaschia aquimarina TaxID=935700 RepID=A0A0D1EF37_9RHOB|nr:molybdopterin-binding protein [Jannaschia aquimarina]KIT15506.1 Molybdopterin molybdenumtransferase [Jannaschia aquimarina]SNT34267.1 molybdopterin molybdotransferase [Jannaschia aquimarina]